MTGRPVVALVSLALAAAGCGEGSSISHHGPLTGCEGEASAEVPASGDYFLTTFGATTDSGTMSCGQDTDHGSWYYAASRQRYGCGARLRLTSARGCVVVEADDYGPDVCVEAAAGGAILDASPLAAQALYGIPSAGWSQQLPVHVEQVDRATQLGPCVLAER